MPEFAWPWMFALAPLPWLVARFVPPAPITAALRLPHPGLQIFSRAGLAKPRWSLLWLLAWLLLLAAAARPQLVGPATASPHTGRAMMLAIDISGSMQTMDMRLAGRRTNRFVATKAIVDDFIDRRQGDELGLILFGTHAYLVTPLTWDLTTVRKQLNASAVGLAGRQTAIGDAIAIAVRHLQKLPSRARDLILLTDGVNTAGTISPQKAAQLAKAADVRIYTIGVGSEQGSLAGFFGRRLASREGSFDARFLHELAQSTGGHFYRANDTAQLAEAWQAIARLEPIQQKARPLQPRRELFRWPLLAAIVLALAGALWRTRPGVREAVS